MMAMSPEELAEKRRIVYGPMGGRPTSYTPELADEILHRLSCGETLSAISSDEHIPAVGTVLGWVEDDRQGFRAAYTRARRLWASANADRVMDRAMSSTDVASASASRAVTAAAALLLPAFDRATFGAKQEVQVTEVRRLTDDELRIRTLEALAARPELIPMALARAPHLEPELRARGLLGVDVVEGQATVQGAGAGAGAQGKGNAGTGSAPPAGGAGG